MSRAAKNPVPPVAPRRGPWGGTERPGLGSPWPWILLLLVLAVSMRGLVSDIGARRVPYSELREALRARDIERVVLSNQSVRVYFAHPPGEPMPIPWVATRVEQDSGLVQTLTERGITYEATSDNGPLALLAAWMLPLLLLSVAWSLLLRRAGGGVGQGPPGVMGFGKSRARVYVEQNTGVTFGDVAGVDEASEELREIVEFLKTPEKFRRLGGRIPKGVLLVGPPGTGKTLLARAVAGEANVPFFSLSGSEFVEMFVGVGAARVRDLFAQAAARAPCIIFIDELDAIGKARNAGLVSGHDEREQTLNQLLAEMDGFDNKQGLIVMAATNRPEILDPALMRPGRFDRHVLVDRPDRRGREKILDIHARGVRLGADVKLPVIASQTPGFAGADLANIVNEAALLAGRAGRDTVSMTDFNEAIERVTAGLQKRNRRIGDMEKRLVAFHESGHALVGTVLPHGDQVHKVSIVPRGMAALGYTRQLPTDDRYLMTLEELRDRLATLLGGRAAEELTCQSVSTGAANDLRQATELARLMVCEYGMSDRVGPLSLMDAQRSPFLNMQGTGGGDRTLSEKTSQLVDGEVSRLMHEALERARAVVRVNRGVLDRLAQRLLQQETLEGDEVRQLLTGARDPERLHDPTSPRLMAMPGSGGGLESNPPETSLDGRVH